MSDYTQVTDYSTKDALASGDAAKKILGSEIDAEFGAIATAIASKANTAAPALTGAATLGGNPLTAFPSGTAMVFAQTAAPTGWTKSTTHNDKALRVVSGAASSGGATAFTGVFGAGKSAGSYTLTTNDIPSHTHTDSGHTHRMQANDPDALTGPGTNSAVALSRFTDDDTGGSTLYRVSATKSTSVNAEGDLNSGSGTASLSSTGGGGGHSHTLSLDLQYVDVIIATKD